jgi:threonine/homoserine/homoserine lactone efflux protein
MQDVRAGYHPDMCIDGIALFLSVAGAHFLALLSPGADFVLIVRTGLGKSLSRAFGVAVGISVANGLYIAACLAGLASLIAASPAILGAIQAAGGAYLLRLGIGALRSCRSAADIGGSGADRGDANLVPCGNPETGNGIRSPFAREFVTGFGSSILNPKLPLFYLGLFSLLANSGTSVSFGIILGVWMTAVVLAWDSFILFMLTRKRMRTAFLGRVRLIDRVSGVILALIGFRLLFLAICGFLQ